MKEAALVCAKPVIQAVVFRALSLEPSRGSAEDNGEERAHRLNFLCVPRISRSSACSARRSDADAEMPIG